MQEEITNSSLSLITGGARSGKSSFAEKAAAESGRDVIYLATAHAGDPEMQRRIERHRRSRPSNFCTRETPLDPLPVLEAEGSESTMILLDCFTILLSNRLLREAGIDREDAPAELLEDASHLEGAAERVQIYVQELAEALQGCLSPVLVVTNEVGMGLVPDNLLGRVYRDLAGRSNQLLAFWADQVWFVVSGIPRRFK